MEIQKLNQNITALPSNYQEAVQFKENLIWNQLKDILVIQALELWGKTLRGATKTNYLTAIKSLSQRQLIRLDLNLQEFSLLNHETIVDEIKLIPAWSEATRQAKAAAFISFTAFLQRRTGGMIHKAMPNKEGTNKTFFKVREKVKTNALNPRETVRFLAELDKINPRDGLIAKLILQGGKRKSEVLELRTNQIDFNQLRIHFRQSKTRGTEKTTVINYPQKIMDQLKIYINNRAGFVFVTKNNKSLAPFQLDRNFLLAGVRSEIAFRVTPHVLRVTLVTRLKELKVQDSDIMKITGHVNPAQLSNYDKSDQADNASLTYQFV